jgi:hypothetical protein
MNRLARALLAALALAAAAPSTAEAGVVFELSLGSGARIDPEPQERIPTNIMLATGFSFASMLRLELGLIGYLSDVQDSKFDMSLRPMIVVAPPLLPLYVRGIFAVNGLVEGPTSVGWGAALGLSFGMFGIGGFIEAGYLPQDREVEQADGSKKEIRETLVEGRIGAYWD